MRFKIVYQDANCDPIVGVPPESIWVTTSTWTGNVKVNDQPGKIFANDSTDGSGVTRFTITSLSGSGKLRVNLFIRGSSSGVKTITVRTTDTDANERVTTGDTTSVADLNYNGIAGDTTDVRLVRNHFDDWRRNALHGALVRRTNFLETGDPHSANHNGARAVFWSPSGRWVSLTAHIGNPADTSMVGCVAFIAGSEPPANTLRQFTFFEGAPDTGTFHDYDPSWSPLGDQIVFDREDWRILRKGIPGVQGVTDTLLHLVSASNSKNTTGDDTPAISPNGQWVAIARRDTNDLARPFNLWKVPIAGGAGVQLTSNTGQSNTDFYPRWSPDGTWIYFDHQTGYQGGHGIWKVKSAGDVVNDGLQAVYDPPEGVDTTNAASPNPSPDGLILTAGIGKRSEVQRYTYTNTLDPLTPKPILNYPDVQFAALPTIDPILCPVLSPDGTRLLISAPQVWAARRNMNLPPVITAITRTSPLPVTTYTVNDTTPSLYIEILSNQLYTFQVSASDPEGDLITYNASFLQPWMVWYPADHHLSMIAPHGPPWRYVMVFQVTTPSGGCDALVATIAVDVLSGAAAGASGESRPEIVGSDGPNPTHGRFALATPEIGGAVAELAVFDLAGRRLASVRGPSGSQLIWNGRDADGALVTPGLYFYRVQAGWYRRDGKVVLTR